MRDLSMGSVSGVFYHQTLNILAASGNGSSNATSIFGQNGTVKFNPSMAIIIIVLVSAFLFIGFFSIYLRRCVNDNATPGQQGRVGQFPTAMPEQGLDRAVVETLPMVGYSLLKGLKGGKDLSECAVCLSDFEDDDDVRLLPKCGHVFHPDCIDMWFFSHSTCPLCRASVGPSLKTGPEATTVELQVLGSGPVMEASIHGGPPAPPNDSVLELLSRDGAERLLANSLSRHGDRLDPRLSRREVAENGERAVEMRALNRALSRNSTSLRMASRGVEVSERIGAANDSARFNSSPGSDGMESPFSDKREKKSLGSSRSFNMALRRSSSVGSSGRYIRQLFGNYTDYFSTQSEQDGSRVHRTRLLGTQHRLPIENRVVRPVDPNGEATGSLSAHSKGKESVEERTKTDRWSFGSSMRRTFSFKGTSSDSRDTMESTSYQSNSDSAKWYSQMMPAAPPSKPKKFASPWVGAMKMRTTTSGEHSPSGAFPLSLPVSNSNSLTTGFSQSLVSNPNSPSTSFPLPVRDVQHQELSADGLSNPSSPSTLTPIAQSLPVLDQQQQDQLSKS